MTPTPASRPGRRHPATARARETAEKLLAELLLPRFTRRPACAGAAPAFDGRHDDEGDEEMEARQHQAAAICRECPVRAECGDVADADPSADGVWAGVPRRHASPAELAAHRRATQGADP